MQKVPNTFPTSHGSYALLKVLSTEGDEPVFLAAKRGHKRPRAIKTMRLQGQGAVDLALFRAETKNLARMHCPQLATVLESAPIDDQIGLVMDFVPGKSLATICERVAEYSILLPPELGLIVAHDIFAALEFFHAFEGGSRVHSNISPRTILVTYSGDAKLAGFRPGFRTPTGATAHLAEDLKPVASLLFDLRFEMFPKELTRLVPRLLEDNVSPAEGMALVRAFLHDHAPSPTQRQSLAAWLEDVFQENSYAQEVQEKGRLLAAGNQVLALSHARPNRISVVGGAIALLALVGGAGLLMAHRGPGRTLPQAKQVEPTPSPVASTVPAVPVVPPAAGLPSFAVPSPVPPTDPGASPAPRPEPPAEARESHVTKPRAAGGPVDRLLVAADMAFDAGKRIEAVHLGLQALKAGGGLRAHLALGEYYRSMHRYREAMNHYRAAAEIEPENKLAESGVRMLENKLSPCQ